MKQHMGRTKQGEMEMVQPHRKETQQPKRPIYPIKKDPFFVKRSPVSQEAFS